MSGIVIAIAAIAMAVALIAGAVITKFDVEAPDGLELEAIDLMLYTCGQCGERWLRTGDRGDQPCPNRCVVIVEPAWTEPRIVLIPGDKKGD